MASHNEYQDGYYRLPDDVFHSDKVRFDFNAKLDSTPERTKLEGFALRMFGLRDKYGNSHPEIGITITAEQFLDLIESMKDEFESAQKWRKDFDSTSDSDDSY